MTIDLDLPTAQVVRSAQATFGPITLRNRIIETSTTEMCA